MSSVAATTDAGAGMEIAGQWRREWAGTAEYGKVTEGGVTRRVARAMEVLHATAPGARVRVLRAAYHESAGPGKPAASYLMHSSRRVISSGFNMLDPPSFPSKPLEIFSAPLESSPERNTDTEEYKVTEPDDLEISEPSKWKSSDLKNTRMPSEESSSTGTASIIDLDTRQGTRKQSYDSECSDLPSHRRNSVRASPLLDAPVALSTLKYKSLLNGSSEWNNRRKSYSFEDASPLNEPTFSSNDIHAMESSTDSGICKSSEVVNDPDETFGDKDENNQEDSFKDWLHKNRSNPSFYKSSPIKSDRKHNVLLEDPNENNISLQSKGRVVITLPVTIDKNYVYKKYSHFDDIDRKAKKVEFSKTELHFGGDSGVVDIIATDQKPPPNKDFKKRKSAFVPINGTFDKPVTLLSEIGKPATNTTIHNIEIDENTAATKSILKNKIPKPKPYLLGENMELGKDYDKKSPEIPTAVVLINRQLQPDSNSSSSESSFGSPSNAVLKNWASKTGPNIKDSLKLRKSFDKPRSPTEGKARVHTGGTTHNRIVQEEINYNAIKKKVKIIENDGRVSPKTRQLREKDLTYFGIGKEKIENTGKAGSVENIFIKKNWVNNRPRLIVDTDDDSDTPEYANLPMQRNFAPVPYPRKQTTKPINVSNLRGTNQENVEERRSRPRRPEAPIHPTRSISEPPKITATNKSARDSDTNENDKQKKSLSIKKQPNIDIVDESCPKYENFNEVLKTNEGVQTFKQMVSQQAQTSVKNVNDIDSFENIYKNLKANENHNAIYGRKIRTEKLSTPDNWDGGRRYPVTKPKNVVTLVKKERQISPTRRRDSLKTRTRDKSPTRTGNNSPTRARHSSPNRNRSLTRHGVPTLPNPSSPTWHTNSPKKLQALIKKEENKYNLKHKQIFESSAKEMRYDIIGLKDTDISKNKDEESRYDETTTKRVDKTGESLVTAVPTEDRVVDKHDKRSSKRKDVTKKSYVDNKREKSPVKQKLTTEESARTGSNRRRVPSDADADHRRRSVSPVAKHVILIDRIPGAPISAAEYIIKYDEKNGTMSSIRKVVPSKKSSKDKLQDKDSSRAKNKIESKEKKSLRNANGRPPMESVRDALRRYKTEEKNACTTILPITLGR